MNSVAIALVNVLALLATTVCGPTASGQVEVPAERLKSFTDDDMLHLPSDLQELTLRGNRGYGADQVTDVGIARLTHCTQLRILRAGGLGLTDRCLESISKLRELEELSLDSNLLTGAGLERLSSLPRLKKLNLNFNRFTEDPFESLAQLTGLIELQAIGSRPVTDQTLESCSRILTLETLVLAEQANGVTDHGLKALSKLSRLRNLSLKEAPVTSEGLQSIGSLKNLRSLRLSDLHDVPAGSLSWVANLPELKVLELAQIRMNRADLEAVNALPRLERLLLWNVFSTEPVTLEIEHLDQLKSLRELRTNEPVSRSGIRDLSSIQSLESITDELTLITDDELIELARLPKLHTLCLGSDKITARSLPALARMTALRSLFVTVQVRLSPSQLAALGRDSLPDCQIQLLYPPYTVFHQARATPR